MNRYIVKDYANNIEVELVRNNLKEIVHEIKKMITNYQINNTLCKEDNKYTIDIECFNIVDLDNRKVIQILETKKKLYFVEAPIRAVCNKF